MFLRTADRARVAGLQLVGQVTGHAVDEAHFNLALILRSFERYDEALKHLDQALKIDPSYSKAQEVVRDIRRAKWLANQRRPPTRLGTVDVKRRVPVRGRASGR